MGRGDTKTTKGKIFKGSSGNARPKAKKVAAVKKAEAARAGARSGR